MAKQSDEVDRVQRIPTDLDQYTKKEESKEISVHHIFLN